MGDSLEEIRYVSARAIRPRDVRGIRLKARRHHVQNGTDAVAATSFLRVVVHPETAGGKRKRKEINQGRQPTREFLCNDGLPALV